MRPSTERLLLRVAHLYYVENLIQEQIAPLVGLSRSRVSRLLKEARERGYVWIHIRHPNAEHSDMERVIEQRFGLKEVVVLGAPEGEVKSALGVGAAAYLGRVLRARLVLGVAWGSTVGQVVSALTRRAVPGVRVVQMTGSIYEHPISAGELTRRLAEALDGEAFLLLAPAVVDSAHVCRAILSDTKIRRVFDLHKRIDVALFGIGAIQPVVSSSLVSSGFLRPSDLRELRAAGVVADLCSSFLLPGGGVYRGALAKRVIAISVENLSRVPLKIAVAGGVEKVGAIAAACRASMVDVLITDAGAAAGLCRLESPTRAGSPAGASRAGGG